MPDHNPDLMLVLPIVVKAFHMLLRLLHLQKLISIIQFTHLLIEIAIIIIEIPIHGSNRTLHLNKNQHILHHLSPFLISKNSPLNSRDLSLLLQDLTTRSAIWLPNLMMSIRTSFHLKKTWKLIIIQTLVYGTIILIVT